MSGGKPINLISIHAPAWGATYFETPKTESSAHFNPRARVGRDLRALKAAQAKDISIHAPAWGATGDYGDERGGAVISIHAPAWGATHHAAAVHLRAVISIHAPAWGATPQQRVRN